MDKVEWKIRRVSEEIYRIGKSSSGQFLLGTGDPCPLLRPGGVVQLGHIVTGDPGTLRLDASFKAMLCCPNDPARAVLVAQVIASLGNRWNIEWLEEVSAWFLHETYAIEIPFGFGRTTGFGGTAEIAREFVRLLNARRQPFREDMERVRALVDAIYPPKQMRREYTLRVAANRREKRQEKERSRSSPRP